jgi:hypothetical protein
VIVGVGVVGVIGGVAVVGVGGVGAGCPSASCERPASSIAPASPIAMVSRRVRLTPPPA